MSLLMKEENLEKRERENERGNVSSAEKLKAQPKEQVLNWCSKVI